MKARGKIISLFVCFALICGLFACTQPAYAAVNLVTDPGFENYSTSSADNYIGLSDSDKEWRRDKMADWIFARATTSVKYSGEKSFQIMCRNNAIYRDFSGLKKNTDYMLSFYWYMEQYTEANDHCIKDIIVGNDLTLTDSNMYNNILVRRQQVNATGEWQKMSLVFNTGDSDSIRLFLMYYSMEGNHNFYMDELSLTGAEKVDITGKVKTSSAIEPLNGDFTGVVGEDFDFKVISRNEEFTVKAGDMTLTPDENGVYSFTVTGPTEITVNGEGDDLLPYNDRDEEGNLLTGYDRELYLKSVNEGDTVYHEAGLFYTGRDTIKLLYPVDEIVSLRSYDLQTFYIEGLDYEITDDGRIKRLEGSRIPVYTKPLTTTTKPEINAFPINEPATEWLNFIGDTEYPAHAIAVTYKHSKLWDGGYQPVNTISQKNRIPEFMKKLENGEEINIAIFGDSGACGWSSSGLNSVGEIYDDTNTEGNFKEYVINVAPYTPTWMDMFMDEVRDRYPDATINVKNLALGGTASYWGYDTADERLALWDKTPDLVIVSFGGNDQVAGTSYESYKNNIKNLINKVRNGGIKNGSPNAEFILMAPKVSNPRAVFYSIENTVNYEKKLIEIQNELDGIAVVRNASYFANVLGSKDAVDYLNTNVNHGNDFFARIYARHALDTLFSDPVPGDINRDGELDDRDTMQFSRYLAKWSDIIVNDEILDADDSKIVDDNDVNQLKRYLAYWPDITIK